MCIRDSVFYRGQVGYAPTISQALSQVGINPAAAQDIEVVDEDAPDTRTEADMASPTSPEQNEESEEASGSDGATTDGQSPIDGAANRDEALENINTALRNLEDARDGSFEEYGRALDALDRAVEDYQRLQD